MENCINNIKLQPVDCYLHIGQELQGSGQNHTGNDIVTIDLSPQKDNIWGDYARTLVFENGVLCDATDRIKNAEWRRGLQMEEYLHKTLIDVATPDMTFEELYYFINDLIVKIPNMDIREKTSIILITAS